MTLIGGQDTGLGNVDTAGQAEGEGTGSIVEITSSDASVEVTNPFGPVVDLKVPGSVTPASAVTGLTFPIVAGVPTLTAGSPVVLAGELGVEGELFAEDGLQVTGDALVTGNAQIDGTTDFLGAVHAHTGAPVQIDDALTSNTSTSLNGTTTATGTNTLAGTTGINGVGDINGQPIAAQIIATTVNGAGTPLSGISAVGLTIGAFAWVASVGAYFKLQTSALTVDHITVENASGLAGAQWLRTNWLNPVWAAQTAWFVNTSTGSDEAAGTVGAPLKTVSEAARRLAYATITGTTVTVTGNMAAGDNPAWTFTCKTLFGFNLVFTTTTLYTGTITTALNVGGFPTVGENNITDTAIPVSYTASGLLAAGVLFDIATASGAADCWAAKDRGSKTLRISQPFNSADAPFANGQTYTASQLATAQQMYFSEFASLTVNIVNALFVSGYNGLETCLAFTNCCFQNAELGPAYFDNCCARGSTFWQGSQTGGFVVLPEWVSGLLIGAGNDQFGFIGQETSNIAETVTLQGAQLLVQGGLITINGNIASYDCTSYPIQASYWGLIMWYAGAFGGNNNAELAEAEFFSQFAHTTKPLWLAGSSTDTVTPISVHGTAGMTVAAETAGTGNVNTQQNGIFWST